MLLSDALRGATTDLPAAASNYVSRLFPFTKWILNYNLTWLTGDIIAGFTVGLVVVPQSMSCECPFSAMARRFRLTLSCPSADAKIATLDPQIGLYSSFVGVCM